MTTAEEAAESGDMGLSISLSTFWSLCVLTELLRRIFSLTTGSSGAETNTLLLPASLLEEASNRVVFIPLIRLLVLLAFDGVSSVSIMLDDVDDEVKEEEVLRLEEVEVVVVVVFSVADGGVEVLITSSDV